MATALKLRRGTTSQHSTFTGAEAEVTIDTTKDTLVVHDNSTAGGFPLLREDLSNNTNVLTAAGTQTLTNKRINPRVVAASATTGTITPNGDTTDVYKAEGLTGAITIDVPSGTPVDGQKLMVSLEDDGTARAITWTTSAGGFRAIGITLPTTTTATKITYVGCVYNATDSFWDAVATVTEA